MAPLDLRMNKAGIPPSGGDRNLGPAVTAVELAAFICSCVIVILRVLTRIGITYNFGWDDATMIFAQACNIVGSAFVFTEVANGLGRHKYYIAPETYKKFLKYDYLDWAQVFLTLALTKISICLFLLRLSNFDKLRLFLKGVIWFMILSHLPLFLLVVLQCNPIQTLWITAINPAYPGTCFRKRTVEKMVIAQGVFSIVTDFIGAACPILLLWNVKLNFRTRFALCLLMGLGVITGVICIIRTAWSWQTLSDDLSCTYRNETLPDASADLLTDVIVPNAIARIFEVNLGIVLACAPHMKPLFRYVRARISGHDPHAILGRHRRPSVSHQSFWYQRLLPSSRQLSLRWGESNSLKKKRSESLQQQPPLPTNVLKMSRVGREVDFGQGREGTDRTEEDGWRHHWGIGARRTEIGTQESEENNLGLPLEGIKKTVQIDVEGQDSTGSEIFRHGS